MSKTSISITERFQVERREMELLAHYLKDPQTLKASVLLPEHFGNEVPRTIFRAMRNLQDGRLRPGELQRELERMDASISDRQLMDLRVLEPEQTDAYVTRELGLQVIEAATRVGAVHRADQAVRKLKDPQVPFPDALKDMAALVVDAQGNLLANNSPKAADLFAPERRQRFGQRFYTGWESIDTATRGFREGQVIIINAPYKSYKTRLIVNLVHHIVAEGWAVSYQTLEDNAWTIMEKLLAVHTSLHEHTVEGYYENTLDEGLYAYADPILRDAREWATSRKLTVYDASHGVYDYQTLGMRILSDKMQYGTNLVVLDHMNQYTDDPETLGNIYRSLVQIAQEAQVAILAASQQSNDSILNGTHRNMLATRGSGTGGMVAHYGFEIKFNPSKIEAIKVIDDAYLAYLKRKGCNVVGLVHDRYVKEVGLWLKILRRGEPTKFWLYFEPTSGRLVDIRSDADPEDRDGFGSLTSWDWES